METKRLYVKSNIGGVHIINRKENLMAYTCHITQDKDRMNDKKSKMLGNKSIKSRKMPNHQDQIMLPK